MDEEQMKAYHENVNIKQMMKESAEREESFRQSILGQGQWKQEVINGLLNIQRQTKVVEKESGETVLQDFIKLEDGTGEWRQPRNLSDEQMDQIKSGGICNEKGAKFIIGFLNSVDNNNIALSNMSQERINEVCREAEISLRTMLSNRRNEFDIKNPSDVRQIIAGIVRPNMAANFSKSKNGQFVKELLRQTRMMGSLDEEDEDGDWFDSLK